jgi:hypothetical protein
MAFMLSFSRSDWIPFGVTVTFWICMFTYAFVKARHELKEDEKKKEMNPEFVKQAEERSKEFKRLLEEKGFTFKEGGDKSDKERTQSEEKETDTSKTEGQA